CKDGSIGIIDISTQKYRQVIRSHTECIHSISINPHSSEFATCSSDGTVRVWDLGLITSCERVDDDKVINKDKQKQHFDSNDGIQSRKLQAFALGGCPQIAEMVSSTDMPLALAYCPPNMTSNQSGQNAISQNNNIPSAPLQALRSQNPSSSSSSSSTQLSSTITSAQSLKQTQQQFSTSIQQSSSQQYTNVYAPTQTSTLSLLLPKSTHFLTVGYSSGNICLYDTERQKLVFQMNAAFTPVTFLYL
ncbi:MAG: hypothetical protein EZS28_038385, partial [Streblomastix strix]